MAGRGETSRRERVNRTRSNCRGREESRRNQVLGEREESWLEGRVVVGGNRVVIETSEQDEDEEGKKTCYS